MFFRAYPERFFQHRIGIQDFSLVRVLRIKARLPDKIALLHPKAGRLKVYDCLPTLSIVKPCNREFSRLVEQLVKQLWILILSQHAVARAGTRQAQAGL